MEIRLAVSSRGISPDESYQVEADIRGAGPGTKSPLLLEWEKLLRNCYIFIILYAESALNFWLSGFFPNQV